MVFAIGVLLPLVLGAAPPDETVNGMAALTAILEASPKAEKAPETRSNPFLTMPGSSAKGLTSTTAKPAATTVRPAQPAIEGNPMSGVRVIVFEDLQCADCATFRRMLDEKLLPAYKDKVAFEHRDFPLPKHAWARKAAIAARYFEEAKPEIAVEFRRQMLAGIGQTTADNFNDRLSAFAKQYELDPAKVIAALDEARFNDLVEKDYQDGIARGVSKTPTVYVGGEAFVESFTFEQVSKAIDEELKR